MDKTFSVIVANFNNNKYLPALIKSVQEQSYPNWELIIVDDGSGIKPEKELIQFTTDERIKIIYHGENMGAGAAFRTGAKNAIGFVIGMLGADDALVPSAIEKMMKAHIASPDVSLINSDCYWCDENLNIIEKFKHYRPLANGEHLIKNLTVGSFATFKRSAYLQTPGFDANLRRAVDHDIFLKLDEVGKLSYINEPLYLYRKNSIGISQNENGIRAAQYSIIAKLNAYERRRKITGVYNISSKEAENIKKVWFTRELYFLRKEGKKKEMRKTFIKAIKEFPFLIFRRSYTAHLIRIIFGR